MFRRFAGANQPTIYAENLIGLTDQLAIEAVHKATRALENDLGIYLWAG